MFRNKPNIVLVGFMGAGKSTIGKALAELLHRPFVDTDELIVEKAGLSIPEVFAQRGEAAFRELEAAVIQEAAQREGAVIAVGGGSVTRVESLMNLRQKGVLVHLAPPFELILPRIMSDPERPMAALGEEGLRRLYQERAQWYNLADYEFSYGAEDSPAEVAKRIASLLARDSLTFTVKAKTRSYSYLLGSDFTFQTELANLRRATSAKALLVTDTTVGELYGAEVSQILSGLGWQVKVVSFPSGEGAKNLQSVEAIWEAGFDFGLDRKSVIFALGGGVIGDLAGFAAATFMRGIPFVILPTTLLAMVDSSVGGKTGVNHRRGKNLVGAFHQPWGVYAALKTLGTLDDRNLAAGWAEVVKSALIGDPAYYHHLASSKPSLRDVEHQAEAIFRSAKVKASIVARDEHEAGLRKQLNLGHTLGHGLEQALGYGTWLHGEAVSVGLVSEAWIAGKLGLAKPELANELAALLAHYGLPVSWPEGLELDAVMAPILLDKKNTGGRITLLLVVRPGQIQEVALSQRDYRNLLAEFRGEKLC
ncbi:MAG: 3-dehydroquinate synthase [Firmicutes bacterium]|nr:3-dehydroquinate synthase [Bacillota bacterium]